MGENIAKHSALVLNSGERGGGFRSSERPLGTAGRSGGRFQPLSCLFLPAAAAWSGRSSADSIAALGQPPGRSITPSAAGWDINTQLCCFTYNSSLVLFHGVATHLNQMVSGLN